MSTELITGLFAGAIALFFLLASKWGGGNDKKAVDKIENQTVKKNAAIQAALAKETAPLRAEREKARGQHPADVLNDLIRKGRL